MLPFSSGLLLRQYRDVRTWTLVIVALAACAPNPPVMSHCEVTPSTQRTVNGYLLTGKANRDVFLYPAKDTYGTERRGPEKLLVFLARIPQPPPGSITVEGENTGTGTRRSYTAERHTSEFGTEWGTNFTFPDAGCWRMSVRESSNEGQITIEVK